MVSWYIIISNQFLAVNGYRERSQAAIQQKAQRGELYLTIPAAYIKTNANQLKKNPD